MIYLIFLMFYIAIIIAGMVWLTTKIVKKAKIDGWNMFYIGAVSEIVFLIIFIISEALKETQLFHVPHLSTIAGIAIMLSFFITTVGYYLQKRPKRYAVKH